MTGFEDLNLKIPFILATLNTISCSVELSKKIFHCLGTWLET